MSAYTYTEDQLVEQPAIGLFAELGWTTVSALEETFGGPSPGLAATLPHPTGEGASLGRGTKGEVVLVPRLRQTATFGPLGLWGPAYWYGVWPLHQLVFAGMLRGIVKSAEQGT